MLHFGSLRLLRLHLDSVWLGSLAASFTRFDAPGDVRFRAVSDNGHCGSGSQVSARTGDGTRREGTERSEDWPGGAEIVGKVGQ
ncbi:hypothetical protein E2C01_067618 [Portunus trituberculatus]|uniref:Secreted protein n=1 Tax=Portunus trituberculatus TaxID=210409 RepID=A0A5B7HU31_PORTR|nr:hypothetical protein [Portunus trituberculatus]